MNIVKEEIFNISNHPPIVEKRIGNDNLIVTVEDVLDDPDFVLKVLKRYPLTGQENYRLDYFKHSFFGGTTFVPMEAFPLRYVITDIINNRYGFDYSPKDANIFIKFNVVNSKTRLESRGLLPHCDNSRFAANLYLNNFPGGTAFYKSLILDSDDYHNVHSHKEKYKKFNQYRNSIRNENELVKWNSIDSNPQWKLNHIEKIKKNKLVIYPGNLFHTMYIKENYSTVFNKYRYSLAFFVG